MLGWIKLHRKLLNSHMYKSLNSKQRDVMIQCLLLANHEDNEWEWGKEIFKCKPGQFVTSLESIKNKCANDVKVQSVRTSLLKLEKWGFLTNESTKTGRLISICKWGEYQDIINSTNKDTNKGLTKSQQRANKELTTNKNDKNVKNDKKILEREKLFKKEVESYQDKYSIDMLTKFFVYWSEPSQSKSKMRYEMQETWDTKRRLITWSNRNK